MGAPGEYVSIFASDAERRSDGNGGFSVNVEMLRLLQKPGYLSIEAGGQRLRDLYQEHSAGADPNMFRQFALYCFSGQIQAITRMVESGQAPDLTGTETPYKFGYCTLVIAGAQRGAAACPGSNHPATLNFLLSRGAPVDSEDIVGYTALHHATQNTSGGALALARMLLSSGANVNHRNRYGEVPILGAFQTNGVDAVELLMEFGADLDIADADGVDPRGFFVRTGPKVTAAVMKWLRKRNGEEKHMDAKKCDACGNVDGVLKYCARCHAARYCSPVCQRAHWSTHKQTCLPWSTASAVTVRPIYRDDGFLLPMADVTRQSMGIKTDPTPAKHHRSAHKPNLRNEEPKQMIIKVQVPYSFDDSPASSRMQAGDLLVYNKKRDFVCSIRKVDDADAYLRISQVVRERGVGGAKAYFAAELKSKEELLIKVGDVLAEQPF